MELAGDINLAMPRHVVDLVGEALNERGRALKGARVGVIGVAFKPNVRDARNTPAADVIAGLVARAARTSTYHDPHVPTFHLPDDVVDGLGHRSTPCSRTATSSWSSRPTGPSTGPRVYERADLVVDTTNTSRGHRVRPRQVLRLGRRLGHGAAPGALAGSQQGMR